MNPKAVALIVFGIIVVITLLIGLFVWWVGQRSGVRRADYKRMQRQLNAAETALDSIGREADLYRELESMLATQVRTHISGYNQKQRELRA
jgi:hypothetical protein